jgi:cytochrome d ubiquinol oxidase subunit II
VFPPVLPAAIAIAAFAAAALVVYAGRTGLGFGLTVVGIIASVATLFVSLYPRLIVSSPDFGNSITVSGAASAHYTLAVMSVVALITLPVVLLYQGWTYYVFRARVTGEEVKSPGEVLERGAEALGVDAPGSSSATT